MIKPCKICGQNSFKEIFSYPKGFFSDGNILNSSLEKEECVHCGTIRTKLQTNLDEFYKSNYSPSRNIDTVAISNNEQLSRSDFVFDWIKELTNDIKLDESTSLIEIGCGQGYLLEKFENKNKFGVEPSISASEIAGKIADVRNIGYEEISNNESYDTTLSYCVIEHVEDPNLFLEKNYNILKEDGIMIIALPIQDKFNYDLLFVDHIHHFNHINFNKLLKKNGFEIINYQLGKESYSNIAMYICKKTQKESDNIDFTFIKNQNTKSIDQIFKNIDLIIKTYQNKPLYAFGYGEISKTIIPYTDLDQYITKYVDDYSISEKVITSKRSKKIFKDHDKINLILMVNPVHQEKIKQLYSEFDNINFLNIFENIPMENK